MPSRKLTLSAILVVLLVPPPPVAGLQGTEAGEPVAMERPRIHVPRVEVSPPLDPALTHPVWDEAARLADWVQTSPGDNTPPVGETVALLLHDDEAIWIAVHARDLPGGVRWATHRRNVVHRQAQDYIGLHIDTFNDRRQTFYFVANPVGIQGDGIYRESFSGYVPWEGIFDTVGEVEPDGSGFRVLFRIPFSTLRFRQSPTQVWGFHLLRRYGRSEAEDSPWPMDRDLGCDFCQLGTMVLEGVEPGRNLEVNPAMVAGAAANRPDPTLPMSSLEGSFEPSLNLKYGLTPNLTLDATLNPDFSQVEADAGQLEVNNRFAIFLPETRPFFQEGAGVFATGFRPPSGGRPPVNLFHSRTIIEPDWGGKVSGKTGRVGIGGLVARDAASPPDLEGVLVGSNSGKVLAAVGRVTVDVGTDGYLGTVLTHRGHGGNGDQVAAMDARIRLGDNLVLSGMGATSRFGSPWPGFDGTAPGSAEADTPDPAPEGGGAVMGQAIHLQANWQSRNWIGGFTFLDITPDFRTPLGFVPRTDQLMVGGSWAWIWRGTGLVRRFEPSVTWDRIWTHGSSGNLFDLGLLADERWEPGIAVDLARASRVELGYSRTFTAYRGESFPDQDRVSVDVRSDALSRLQVQGSMEAGEGVIFADRTAGGLPGAAWALEGSLQAVVRPHSSVRMDVGARGSRIWRRDDEASRESLYATAVIPRVRSEVQLTPRWGIRGILEQQAQRFYAEDGPLALQDDELLFDLLLSYVVNHGTAVYVGWTQLHEGDLERSLATSRRGGVAKVTYVWRF
jgi:hypothetical protein